MTESYPRAGSHGLFFQGGSADIQNTFWKAYQDPRPRDVVLRTLGGPFGVAKHALFWLTF